MSLRESFIPRPEYLARLKKLKEMGERGYLSTLEFRTDAQRCDGFSIWFAELSILDFIDFLIRNNQYHTEKLLYYTITLSITFVRGNQVITLGDIPRRQYRMSSIQLRLDTL